MNRFETAVEDVAFYTTTKEIFMEPTDNPLERALVAALNATEIAMEKDMPEVEPTTDEVLESLDIRDDLAMLHNEIATVRAHIKKKKKVDEFYEVYVALTKAMAEVDLVQK